MEVSTPDNKKALEIIKTRYNNSPKLKDQVISFNVTKGNEFLVNFVKNFELPINSVNLRRPTINDVFLNLTGREIRDEGSPKKVKGNNKKNDKESKR